jgi:hypothetical protein
VFDADKALTKECSNGMSTGLGVCNTNRFKNIFKLMTEQAGLGNTIICLIPEEPTPMRTTEAVLMKEAENQDVYAMPRSGICQRKEDTERSVILVVVLVVVKISRILTAERLAGMSRDTTHHCIKS